MPRRSKEQIAADCGLLPGEKPSSLQIRQSKEIARAREALASTSNPQPPKRPKVKVPQSKPAVLGSQSHSTLATNQALQPIVTPQRNLSLKTTGKSMAKEIESEESEMRESTYNSPRFNNDDLDHLLSLMAMQENQDCLFGSGSITAVDGTTRAGCWETLATLMNVYHNNRNKKSSAHANNRMKLNGPGMMKRWRTMKEKYIETKKYFDQCTGSGLLDKDYENGIDTTKKKKEQMCPKFQTIHDIYGHKSNVTPHAILDTAHSKDLSISAHDAKVDDGVIDPSLDSQYHYQPNSIEGLPELELPERSTGASQQLDPMIDSNEQADD